MEPRQFLFDGEACRGLISSVVKWHKRAQKAATLCHFLAGDASLAEVILHGEPGETGERIADIGIVFETGSWLAQRCEARNRPEQRFRRGRRRRVRSTFRVESGILPGEEMEGSSATARFVGCGYGAQVRPPRRCWCYRPGDRPRLPGGSSSRYECFDPQSTKPRKRR